ncbi:MAG: hypothetical protein ABSB59_41755 [Streptosporangiaceae bacterium]|jgi:hypothetical protein
MTQASHQQVEIGPWGHGGSSFADTLRPSGAWSAATPTLISRSG